MENRLFNSIELQNHQVVLEKKIEQEYWGRLSVEKKESQLFGDIIEFIYRIKKDKLTTSDKLHGVEFTDFKKYIRKEAYDYYQTNSEFHAIINICNKLFLEYFQEKEKNFK